MIAKQESSSAESLVPPRPNLGPEPWPEAGRWPLAAGWWGSGLTLVLLFLVVLWRKRRNQKRLAGHPVQVSGPSIAFEDSPRQRWITSSEVVRGVLVGSFGPGWVSKTTEEIGEDPRLLETFDSSEVDRLVAFLRLADRVKFSTSEPESLDDWEPWALSLGARMAAGARTSSSGH